MIDAIAIHEIEPFRASSAAGAVAGIWQQATNAEDAAAQEFANGTFPKHVGWPGFRMFIAAIEDKPVGFIYGYRTLRGQWWHDQVRKPLIDANLETWLENSLELAEVAVLPAFQGRGIGTKLIDAFLQDITRPVILAVEAIHTHAHVLYAAHGFRDLLPDFRYPGWDDHIIVMGRAPEGDSK